MAAYSTDRPDMTVQYLFSPQLEDQPQPWSAVHLEERPAYPYCGLRLSERVPHQEIEAVLVDIGQASQEQNRRLSLCGVPQILEKNEEGMVDKLIGILHVADMTPLANVLDPQVLAFLRTFATER
jgi:hypothetical protein